jgi:integrase/recombinase XerD
METSLQTPDRLLSLMLQPRADHYQVHLKDFQGFIGTEPVTLESIDAYFHALNDEPVSASTKLVRRSAVRNRLRHAIELQEDLNLKEKLSKAFDRVDASVPSPKIQSAPITSDRIISVTEYHALRKAATRRDRLWLAFLYQSGCRISEATGVLLDQCEDLGTTVRLRIHGKFEKERFIRIRKNLFDAICKEFCGQTYLFETREGKRFSRTYVSARIRKLTLSTLGRSLSAHSLRHSFASRAVRDNPGKLEAVSKWLGHSSVGFTLSRYVHDSLTDDEILGPEEVEE